MKYTESLVTKLLITEVSGLDPVTVFIENFGNSRGKLTIEVFGQAWAHYWCSMGTNSLEEFILSADNHYLSKKSSSLNELSEDDYDGFIPNIKKEIIEFRKSGEYTKLEARAKWNLLSEVETEKEWFEDSNNHSLLYDVAGDDFWYSIPSKDTSTYKYLCKILDALKECLTKRINGSAA